MEGKWFWFIHEGGQFPVSFRPFGVLHCPDFPSSSSYAYAVDPTSQGIVVRINFGKYGEYELRSSNSSGLHFQGGLVQSPDKWRRMEFIRDFNECAWLARLALPTLTSFL